MIFRILIIKLILLLLLTGCSTTDTSNLPNCTVSDCNCSDFATQIEAQRVLDAFPDDRYKLDRDGNGIACESLAKGTKKKTNTNGQAIDKAGTQSAIGEATAIIGNRLRNAQIFSSRLLAKKE